jgi:hypothetical protein
MAYVPGSFKPRGSVIFTSSQTWTVPAGVHKIKILAIGGGGGGGGGYSSTYVGGGGGSSGVLFVDMLVVPGLELNIVVGAGGSPGTGGASPTAGGRGGESYIDFATLPPGATSGPIAGLLGGVGGGAATSSANGSGGGGNTNVYTATGEQGENLVMILAAYFASGASGSGQNPGLNSILNEQYSGTGNTTYGVPNGQSNLGWGSGGYGGGVNSNGEPGIQGAVVIWWGDD